MNLHEHLDNPGEESVVPFDVIPLIKRAVEIGKEYQLPTSPGRQVEQGLEGVPADPTQATTLFEDPSTTLPPQSTGNQ